MNISERLKRNVLEICLDKEEISENVEDEAIVKLFQKFGIRKEQVEGVQLVPPRSPRKIFVWFEPGVDLSQYCYNDAYRIGAGV